MAGFGVPSAWGHATPGRAPGGKPATSSIWGRPATRSGGLGGFTLSHPQPGMGGLSGPQTAQAAPGQQVPAPRPAAAGAAGAPATSPQASSSSSSPLDSTYYSNLAADQFKVGNAINNLNQQSANSNTALQSALDQLAYQQPRDQLKVEQNANRGGGLYSSVEAQNQGNLLHSYTTRQDQAVTANAQRQAAIQSQIGALQGGVPIFAGQQYDDAIARAIKAGASNPATGQDASSAAQPSAPAASGAPALTPGRAPASKVNWGLLRKPPSSGRQLAKPNFGLWSRPGGGF